VVWEGERRKAPLYPIVPGDLFPAKAASALLPIVKRCPRSCAPHEAFRAHGSRVASLSEYSAEDRRGHQPEDLLVTREARDEIAYVLKLISDKEGAAQAPSGPCLN